MRIENVNNTNFGARVVLKAPYSDMLGHSPLKKMHDELSKSGTNNVYELGKSTFSNPQRTAGKHEVLLNGEKFGEINQSPADGTFGLVKNFLKKSLDKENSILPQINKEVAWKLEAVREFIKASGLSVENVKKWL